MASMAENQSGTRGRKLQKWAVRWLDIVVTEGFLHPLSFLLLVRSAFVGLGLWAALLTTPRLAAIGFATLFALVVLDGLLRLADRNTLAVEFRANGFLSALLCFWVLSPLNLGGAVMTLAIATTVAIALIVVFFAKAIQRASRLPISVWPYCVVAAILLTFFSDTSLDRIGYIITAQPPTALDWNLPEAFVSGLGVFFLSPSPVTGAAIALVVALWSPAMFFAGLIGWLCGALFSLSIASLGVVVDWVPTSYNSFLVGMALGAVFVVPGTRSLLAAVISGALAAMLAASIQIQSGYAGIAYLPIPFIALLYAGLLVVGRMDAVASDSRSVGHWSRPELARISADWAFARWGNAQGQLLAIPLRGNVEVVQGVDGDLTHRGPWRYALDFQRPQVGAGTPDAYRPSLWGSEVFSPAQGQVVAIRDVVADNAIGTVNYGENWGNYVIIKPDEGAPVMLCHLMAGSVSVQSGQRVSYDTRLGLVGNSGRSARPHLHLQRQVDAKVGAATVPLRLANYFEVDPESGRFTTWRACGVPEAHQIIAPAVPSPDLHALLTGMLPGRALWINTAHAASEQRHLVTRTSLTENGLYKLQAENGDYLEAETAVDALRVLSVAAPQGGFIAALAMVMATIPYASFVGMGWDDTLYVPRHSRLFSLRELAAPFSGAPLTQVSIRLESMDLNAGAVLTCDGRLPGKAARSKVELHLEKQRGPTLLQWDGPTGSGMFELASFEVSES